MTIANEPNRNISTRWGNIGKIRKDKQGHSGYSTKKRSGSEEPLLCVTRSWSVLPVYAEAETYLPLVTGCRGDTAKCRSLKVEVSGVDDEVRMIKRIEHYHPELYVASLREIGPL